MVRYLLPLAALALWPAMSPACDPPGLFGRRSQPQVFYILPLASSQWGQPQFVVQQRFDSPWQQPQWASQWQQPQWSPPPQFTMQNQFGGRDFNFDQRLQWGGQAQWGAPQWQPPQWQPPQYQPIQPFGGGYAPQYAGQFGGGMPRGGT
jgi:hypothetical protein